MSAPDGTAVDRRHPSWCDPVRCEAGRDDIIGDHRSRVMEVRSREPYDLKVRLWLGVPVHGPVDEAPWVHVEVLDYRHNGELDNLSTYTWRLSQAEDLAEALSTMVDLGRSGEPVDEDEWRGGAS